MYIRTKDGVYEVEQSQLEDDEEVVNCDYGQIHKLEIKRKSEYLDELCDEFVLHNDKVTKLWFYEPYDLINEYLREGLNHRYIIYGAIWTEWGLKYVAKMDNEGKLELI